MKRKVIQFNLETEKAVLEFAENQQEKFADYIKKLIEYDMEHCIFNEEPDNRTIQEVYSDWMSKTFG
jgi:hypothetical protein